MIVPRMVYCTSLLFWLLPSCLEVGNFTPFHHRSGVRVVYIHPNPLPSVVQGLPDARRPAVLVSIKSTQTRNRKLPETPKEAKESPCAEGLLARSHPRSCTRTLDRSLLVPTYLPTLLYLPSQPQRARAQATAMAPTIVSMPELCVEALGPPPAEGGPAQSMPILPGPSRS